LIGLKPDEKDPYMSKKFSFFSSPAFVVGAVVSAIALFVTLRLWIG